MNWLLVVALLAVVAWLLAWGMMRRERIYEFPFLTGVITFSFILPQIPGLVDDRFLPEGAFAKTIAFMIVCLFMCWLGWTSKAKPLSFFRWDFSERRLLIVAFLMSVAGAYFYFKLSRLPGELTIGVQMTGVPVMYLFFARLLSYGLCIAAICVARRFSWWAALIIAFDIMFYLDRILVTGKRAEAIELVAMFAISFWFHRGWTFPRSLALAGVVIGTFLMASVGEYRAITQANSAPVWEDISKIDVMANIEAVLKDGGPEMQNAILRLHNTETTMEFDYGTFHWNRLVFSFVPAQLLGARFKESLMLPSPASARDYNPIQGTTETGLADAFQSFWYFGALKFLLLSYAVRRIWITANHGEMSAQLTYILSIVPAMHAISHQTDWVLVAWVQMAMFLTPALAFAVIPGRRRQVPSTAGLHTASYPAERKADHALAL